LVDVNQLLLGRGRERMAKRPTGPHAGQVELRIPDPRMSSNHAVIARVRDKWFIEDSASKNGTRVRGQRITQHELSDGDLIEVGRTVLLFKRDFPADGLRDLDTTKTELPITFHPELEQIYDKLATIAPSNNISILIEGESGTGKEVLARQVARWSKIEGDFVGVNCGALPANLVESELFGSVKGAFSGASANRIGLIRSADRGCLFLDEIADLPLDSQASLLRVLQEHEVTPVGATRPHPVEFRLVSATHQDLDAAVAAGRFRQDLFARVAGFRVSLPPLRERKQDLGILIGQLVESVCPEPHSVSFAPDAIVQLYDYDWPLNVRELANTLTAASLLAGREPIQKSHLPGALETGARPPAPHKLSAQQLEHRQEVVELLQKHKGNVSAISREIGKARNQIQRWMKRYELRPEDYR
jgi:DNA-binding NtrC family response regulator